LRLAPSAPASLRFVFFLGGALFLGAAKGPPMTRERPGIRGAKSTVLGELEVNIMIARRGYGSRPYEGCKSLKIGAKRGRFGDTPARSSREPWRDRVSPCGSAVPAPVRRRARRSA